MSLGVKRLISSISVCIFLVNNIYNFFKHFSSTYHHRHTYPTSHLPPLSQQAFPSTGVWRFSPPSPFPTRATPPPPPPLPTLPRTLHTRCTPHAGQTFKFGSRRALGGMVLPAASHGRYLLVASWNTCPICAVCLCCGAWAAPPSLHFCLPAGDTWHACKTDALVLARISLKLHSFWHTYPPQSLLGLLYCRLLAYI